MADDAGSGEFSLWNGPTFHSAIRGISFRNHQDNILTAQPPRAPFLPLQLVPGEVHAPVTQTTTRMIKAIKQTGIGNSMTWTPDGGKLNLGGTNGDVTLYDCPNLNFEHTFQAHHSCVHSIVWSHDGTTMLTGDDKGYIRCWQPKAEKVKMFQAHNKPIRGISFSPLNEKFASGSEDGTVRIWDLSTWQQKTIMTDCRPHRGHKKQFVDWHPHYDLVVSHSMQNGELKLWDPKSGQCLNTLHAHGNAEFMDAKFSTNGRWLITASGDHLIRQFDIRRLDQELQTFVQPLSLPTPVPPLSLPTPVQTFRSHRSSVLCLSWHPFDEELFCSGGSDGAIFFWNAGVEREVGSICPLGGAHHSNIRSLAWHPFGHMLCSASINELKFWMRTFGLDYSRSPPQGPPVAPPEDKYGWVRHFELALSNRQSRRGPLLPNSGWGYP